MQLSGGLDSSSVASIAAQACGADLARLWAVTTTFPGFKESQELQYSRAVATRSHLRQVVTDVWPSAPEPTLETLLRSYLEPDLVHWGASAFAIRRTAVDLGCRTLLTGVMGDLFGGAAWEYAGGRVRTRGERLRALAASPSAWCERGRRALSRATRSAARYLDHLKGEADEIRLLNPDFVARHQAVFVGSCAVRAEPGSENDENALEIAIRNANLDRATIGTNRASRAQGLSVFHPFLDRRVVEVIAQTPLRIRTRDGYSRWVLREAMRGVLPEQVRLRRGKAKFSRFHEAWYRNVLVREAVPNPVEWLRPAEGYLDLRAVAAEWRQIIERPLGMDRTHALFNVVVLAAWLRELPRLARSES